MKQRMLTGCLGVFSLKTRCVLQSQKHAGDQELLSSQGTLHVIIHGGLELQFHGKN